MAPHEQEPSGLRRTLAWLAAKGIIDRMKRRPIRRHSKSPEPPAPSRPEFALIDWIRQLEPWHPLVSRGIGDDAAVIDLPDQFPAEYQGDEARFIVTTDMLLEGRHFTADTDPELIGRKAIAVNLSDIAAMAGEPVAAFVSLALPKSRGRQLAEALYRGMLPLANEFGFAIAGGDTNSWDGPLVINITLLGQCRNGGVSRQGGQVGDVLLVTGPLGGSLASGRHLTFAPRLKEADTLRRIFSLRAMLDISDGLSSDLPHFVEENQRLIASCRAGLYPKLALGAVIDAAAVPIHDDVDAKLPKVERLQHALSDGEDFELLFATDPKDVASRMREAKKQGLTLFKVGELTAKKGCHLRHPDGTMTKLPASGWTHSFE